jgi:hypothetical protein
MFIVCYSCNYLKVNFGNLLGGEILNFNNGLVSHHQLVMVSINVHDWNMLIYKINLWINLISWFKDGDSLEKIFFKLMCM